MKSIVGKIATSAALAVMAQVVFASPYGHDPQTQPPGAINALSDALVDQADNRPQAAFGFAIGQICPGGLVDEGGVLLSQDLKDRCGEVAGAGLSNNPTSNDGMQNMANEEDLVLGSQVDAGGAQVDAIGQRIATVRGGGGAGLVYQPNSTFNWSTGAAGDGMSSSPWGMFVSGVYVDTDRDTTSLESGFDGESWGVTGGIDYVFSDKLILGAAFGYTSTDTDLKRGGGDVDTDSYSYFAYWSMFPNEHWYIDAMAGYTDNDHDQQRNINYTIGGPGTGLATPTVVNNAAISDTDSNEISVSVTAGRNFTNGIWTISPFGRIDYGHIEIDNFNEVMADTTGNGNGLALRVDGQEFDSLMLSFGSSIIGQFGDRFFAQFEFEHVHEFKNNNDALTVSFVNDSFNLPILMLLDQPDRNFFNIGAGFTAIITDRLTGYARYQALLGYEDLDVQSVEFGLRLGF